MSFEGYLIKFKGGVSSGDPSSFPHKYLAQDPIITPYQRTEASAYRDANNNLHRVTIDNHKSKIELITMSGLTLAQKQELERAMHAGLLNSVERKYHVEYWNDDPDVNDYTEGDFYLADVSYTYRSIADGTIVYNTIKYTFIEY